MLCFSWGCRILEFTSPAPLPPPCYWIPPFPGAQPLCLPCAPVFSSPWKIQNGIFHGEEKNGLEGTLEVILFHPLCSTLILCLISSPFISSCTSDWKFPRMQKKSLLFDPALLTVAFQVESHLSSLFIRVVHHCHARTSFYSFKTHTNGSADYFP